jgi:hypothetical protein
VEIHNSDSFAYLLLCLSPFEVRGAFGGKSGDRFARILGTRHDSDTAQFLFDLTFQGLIPACMHKPFTSTKRLGWACRKLGR